MLSLALFTAVTVSAADFSGNELFIPVVSRVPGAANTEWRTDLIVSNRSETDASQVFVIYEPAGSEVPIQVKLDIDPRGTVTVVDAINELFGKQESYGTLWLSPSNGAVTIAAHARIYNVGNSAGEFGQVIQGLPIDQLTKTAWINGAVGIRNNRTNLGIGNPNDSTAVFSLTWYDKTGVQRGTRTGLTVAPGEVALLNNIFLNFGVVADDGMTIKVSADRPIYAYASVVRNDTGDAYTLIGNGPFP